MSWTFTTYGRPEDPAQMVDHLELSFKPLMRLAEIAEYVEHHQEMPERYREAIRDMALDTPTVDGLFAFGDLLEVARNTAGELSDEAWRERNPEKAAETGAVAAEAQSGDASDSRERDALFEALGVATVAVALLSDGELVKTGTYGLRETMNRLAGHLEPILEREMKARDLDRSDAYLRFGEALDSFRWEGERPDNRGGKSSESGTGPRCRYDWRDLAVSALTAARLARDLAPANSPFSDQATAVVGDVEASVREALGVDGDIPEDLLDEAREAVDELLGGGESRE